MLSAGVPVVASACTCIFTVQVVWPSDGATDVPRRPSLVVQREAQIGITTLLRSPEGHEVALAAQGLGVLATPDECGSELAFLAPVEDLLPNTTYQIVSRPSSEFANFAPRFPRATEFTTGEAQASTLPALAPLSARLYRLQMEGDCPIGCGTYLQLEVSDTLAAQQAPPSWLRLSTPLNGQQRSTVRWLAAPYTAPLLAADADAQCVTYARIDHHGAVIAEGSVCAPEKCAMVSLSPTGAFIGCGAVASLPESAWDLVGEHSCEDEPPHISNEDEGPFKLLPSEPASPSGTDEHATTPDTALPSGEADSSEAAAASAPQPPQDADAQSSDATTPDNVSPSSSEGGGCMLAATELPAPSLVLCTVMFVLARRARTC